MLLIAVVAAAAWVVSRSFDVLLLAFGATLLAIGLRSAAGVVRVRTRIGARVSLVIVLLLLVASLGLSLWFFGTIISAQVDELTRQLPAGLRLLATTLGSNDIGRYALEQARNLRGASMGGQVAGLVGSLASTVTTALGYAALLAFVAIYLAAEPERYRRLIFELVPQPQRTRAVSFLTAEIAILRRWLIGQFAVMLVIGVLSGIGLWALGIHAAFALGLIGGLLCFIPFVGSVLAAIPATLVGLTHSPREAAFIVLMYMGVHLIEGNFITPLIQLEATELPPVLALLSTVVFGTLFGPLGVIFAAPLTVALMTATRMLHVEAPASDPVS